MSEWINEQPGPTSDTWTEVQDAWRRERRRLARKIRNEIDPMYHFENVQGRIDGDYEHTGEWTDLTLYRHRPGSKA